MYVSSITYPCAIQILMSGFIHLCQDSLETVQACTRNNWLAGQMDGEAKGGLYVYIYIHIYIYTLSG